MTIETPGAPASTPPATGATTSATPSAPVPGSAEHRDAMIAAYDAQFKPSGLQPETQVPAAPPLDPAVPVAPEAPKPDDKPTDAPKTSEVTLGSLIESGDLLNGLVADEIPKDLLTQLEATGISGDQLASLSTRLKTLVALEAQVATDKVHKLAGGPEAFTALNAWAQKNLTPEQRTFYNAELEGPNAADAMALLQRKMNAGKEPVIHNVAGTPAPVATGFRDKFEMQAAMSDPRYGKSEAFRAEVASKLRASRF